MIILLTIGSASAADTSINDNNAGDTLSVSETTGGADTLLGASSDGNELLSADGSSFTDLNATIHQYGDNNAVNLTQNYKFDNTTDYELRAGIIINQTNFTIDGSSLARIFTITGTNVTLKNINFINGNASDNGGAILWNGDNATVINSNFTDNIAYGNGATICFTGNEGMTLTDVYFGKNKAGAGLSVNVYDASDIEATVSGYNSYFNSIYTAGSVSLTGSNVKHWNEKEETNDSDSVDMVSQNTVVPDVTVTLSILNENGVEILSFTNTTDDNGVAHFNFGDYYSEEKLNLRNRFTGNDYYFPTEQPPITYSDGGDFQILQNMINNQVKEDLANNIYEHNIVLNRNYTYTIGSDAITDGIQIKWDNVTIDGKGYTIDARGQSKIFKITGNNVTIKFETYLFKRNIKTIKKH